MPFMSLVFILLIVYGAAMAVSPFQTWEITMGWAYRDREANEPSSARLALMRVGGAIIVMGAIAMFGYYLQAAG
ncbi:MULTISPECIES: DUF6199 family natural product biosynthesis protein [Dermabacter]|uniref:DUF6199 domain-containing protein n=2 Tax=Dermabacter TaxID=36739 RepID=A0ABR4SM28_9MICO|nr:DUF6199 family natural product biosynthesis protein [Dermabacter jinjuensis]ATH96048.1 hypothetical protein COP05_02285 [Dermabacter jinjuensis]KDS94169.1 hypothetical protein DHOM_02575 [Dermabacter hominis 1368]MDK8804104.1 hypothetical protein [Dermabacter hominis]UEB90117.1 hypothetical protein LK448_01005 [Dermabacter jinjuensis]